MDFELITNDLEGASIDLETLAHTPLWLEIASDLRIASTFEEMLEKVPDYIGSGDPEVAKRFAHLTGGNAEEILQLKRDQYDAKLVELEHWGDINPREGFVKFLNAAEKAHLPIAIGSLRGIRYTWRLIRASGLGDIFNERNTVLREDVAYGKPAPDVYLETARRFNIDPARQLVFGGSEVGVRAAVAAGSPVIGMPIYYKETVEKLLAAGARAVFRSWKEVTLEKLHQL
ncbi:MAG: HAD family hydrolase [Candidatus Andersenbacteria bacterium]|nr:HAD family hydrolase [Candidatus Andersenbacteria bacterium]MBI3251092.1 HAD family hydrolase [Candidatus Andersenbacteria bacterium]